MQRRRSGEGGLEGKKVHGGERADASNHTALNRGTETDNEEKRGNFLGMSHI